MIPIALIIRPKSTFEPDWFQCIDVSRYLSRDSYCDTVFKNSDTRDLATFLHFLFERHTNITACSSSQRQSAKKYQLMSHVMSRQHMEL